MTGRGRKTERKVEPITASSSSDSDSSSMTQVPIKYAEPITASSDDSESSSMTAEPIPASSDDSESESMTPVPFKYSEPITASSDSSSMTPVPIKYSEPVAGPSGLCGIKRTANTGGAGEKRPKMVPTPSTSSESDSDTAHCSPLGGINWALSKRRRATERLQRAPSRRQEVGHGRRHSDQVPKPMDRKHLQPPMPQKKKCGAQAADSELINFIQREQVIFLTEKLVNLIGYIQRLTLAVKKYNQGKALEALQKAQKWPATKAKKTKKHRRRWEETLEEDAEDETSSDSQRLKTFKESLEDYWREERKANGQFESDSDSD